MKAFDAVKRPIRKPGVDAWIIFTVQAIHGNSESRIYV